MPGYIDGHGEDSSGDERGGDRCVLYSMHRSHCTPTAAQLHSRESAFMRVRLGGVPLMTPVSTAARADPLHRRFTFDPLHRRYTVVTAPLHRRYSRYSSRLELTALLVDDHAMADYRCV